MSVAMFNNNQIDSISKILGELLTGSEISTIFLRMKITDNSGQSTKWKRLSDVFRSLQSRDNSPNSMLRFITEALSPVAFTNNINQFEEQRARLNAVLIFSGIQYCEDGKYKMIVAATTISEAQQRTKNLVLKLQQRGVHYRVLQYCKEELLKDNYFHAVLEATKSLSEYVRQKTGLTEDGSQLFDKAFSKDHPLLATNSLRTESEKNQQVGFSMMLKGINSMVRNVTAHTPKILWIIDEKEAISILLTLSFLHGILDNCVIVPQNNY